MKFYPFLYIYFHLTSKKTSFVNYYNVTKHKFVSLNLVISANLVDQFANPTDIQSITKTMFHTNLEMAILSYGQLIKIGSKNNNAFLLVFLVASLVVIVFGQSSWQDVTTFHPYCRQLFRSCVESSSIGGVGSGDYNVAVGICGNKMAICTFSGNLTWPWSSNIGSAGPASLIVDATQRLNTYRTILESSVNVTSISWPNLTEFLPDCRAEFVRCVDTQGGLSFDVVAGVCGHGMSVCTERQGRWPYGNDSSAFWQQTYTSDRLQLYRNVYSGNLASARNWQNLKVFLPFCQNLMIQCVAASGGSSSDIAVGNCGNLMGICTSENILWPHSYDASAAYIEPYDARWQRYANIINPISRWQDITRFSFNCIDRFFECVYASTNATNDAVIGVCGNQMSLCTFDHSIWPNASQVPTAPESHTTRLGIYRIIIGNMLPSAPSYFTFPPLAFDLSSFSTHTFTNAGATGRFGPTLPQCRSAYSSQPWAHDSRFLDMTLQGIQLWNVPETGSYRIICAGAQGGSNRYYSGGRGAQMSGNFNLVRGQILAILVGQQGGVRNSNCTAGGGGGSFVWSTQSASEPLIAAGGGGGGASSVGRPGSMTTGGTGTEGGRIAGSNRTAGTDGMGATPGGAGWKSNGASGLDGHNQQCLRPLEGGFGGSINVNAPGGAIVGDGGFGGGASASGVTCFEGGGGGGGGYSGGAGPFTGPSHSGGGGGGSYNSGTNQENLGGARLGHGFVTITKLID